MLIEKIPKDDEIYKLSIARMNYIGYILEFLNNEIQISNFQTPNGLSISTFMCKNHHQFYYSQDEIILVNSWFKIGFFRKIIENILNTEKDKEYTECHNSWWSSLNHLEKMKVLFYNEQYNDVNLKLINFDFSTSKSLSDKLFFIQYWLYKEYNVEPFILIDQLEPGNYWPEFYACFLEYLQKSRYFSLYNPIYTNLNIIYILKNQWYDNQKPSYNFRDARANFLKSKILKDPTTIYNALIDDETYILSPNWIIYIIMNTKKSALLCKAIEINLLKYGMIKKLEWIYENQKLDSEKYDYI
jgi:hypothetical protein